MFNALSTAQSGAIALTCLCCGKQEWIANPQVAQAIKAACQAHGAQTLRFRLDAKVRFQKRETQGR